jgi:hypothetical protein
VISRALSARPILGLLLPLLMLLALAPVTRPVEGSGDTFQFWYAGHLVASGHSPYDQRAWHDASADYGAIAANVARNCGNAEDPFCVWAYPPPTAWLFAPFGALPPGFGLPLLNAFVVLSALAGIAAAVVVFGPADPLARTALLTVIVLSHPFAIDVRAGHFVGLLLIGVSLVAHGIRRAASLPIVAGALLLVLKPHVVLAVGLSTVVLLVRDRTWRALGAAAAAIALVVALSLAISPEAIGAIIGRSGSKAGIAWATTWALPLPLAAAVLALAAAASVLALRALRSPAAAIAIAAALSLTIAPYAQPYDALLVVPALALLWTVVPDRRGLIGVASGAFALGTWAAVFAGQLSPPLESAYAVVPAAELALLAVAARRS